MYYNVLYIIMYYIYIYIFFFFCKKNKHNKYIIYYRARLSSDNAGKKHPQKYKCSKEIKTTSYDVQNYVSSTG